MDIERTDVLIVVDVQKDFLPGGALGVPGGGRVIAPINGIMPLFSYVVGTRDWHPKEHPHFLEHGGPWPYHCLQNTPGADFPAKLHVEEFDEILSKGTAPHTHGYDGFEDGDLGERLRARGTKRIFVCGLATDYCVRATALSAREYGFDVVVLTDAIAAVNVKCTDEADALREMASKGIRFATTDELLAAA